MTPKQLKTKKRYLFISDPHLTLAAMHNLLQEYSLINAGYPEVIEMDADTYHQWGRLLVIGKGNFNTFHGIPVRENK